MRDHRILLGQCRQLGEDGFRVRANRDRPAVRTCYFKRGLLSPFSRTAILEPEDRRGRVRRILFARLDPHYVILRIALAEHFFAVVLEASRAFEEPTDDRLISD